MAKDEARTVDTLGQCFSEQPELVDRIKSEDPISVIREIADDIKRKD